jgi:hypothetical protein
MSVAAPGRRLGGPTAVRARARESNSCVAVSAGARVRRPGGPPDDGTQRSELSEKAQGQMNQNQIYYSNDTVLPYTT